LTQRHRFCSYFDFDRLISDALSIWCTHSKPAALRLITSAVRHGKNNALLGAKINRRENQLFTMSRSPNFKLEIELAKFAVDIASL
jgi:hypothetical protein